MPQGSPLSHDDGSHRRRRATRGLFDAPSIERRAVEQPLNIPKPSRHITKGNATGQHPISKLGIQVDIGHGTPTSPTTPLPVTDSLGYPPTRGDPPPPHASLHVTILIPDSNYKLLMLIPDSN